VGVDIGGTFTDLILAESASGRLHRHKRLTTPEQPAEGALAGLDELLAAHSLPYDRIDQLLHGTTLVTNAIIERQGSRTALLTTRGFRDILEMGNEQRYDIYDLFLRFPEPLVPRRRRLEVDERIDRDGAVLVAPDLDAVEAQVAPLVAAGVEALAVCFLHSYRNPDHERRVAERIRSAFPQLAVSVSSELIPEVREFERTATTVANAYVQPRMDRYLGRFETGLAERGFAGRFYLMQSSGGLATPDAARRFPIRFLESGPAGGALISAYLGRAMATPDLLSFDMGGTTAKACLIRGGRPSTTHAIEAGRVHRFKPGSGLPIRTPVVDMIEIGAGGGSIARIDELGLLKVGPDSAGADPGPACYGLGGTAATVSDACLQLGYFDPDAFLGGRMTLLPDAAEGALAPLGAELDLDPTATAWGIYRIVCENMAQAARVHIIERSHDPRRFAVMAFGGAGPAHAARVARILGAPEVIVPQHSGVAAALGFLVAAASFEFSRSYPAEVTDLDWGAVDRLYLDLEARAQAILSEAGVERSAMVFERLADMRFVGQFHEIEVAIPAGSLADGAAERVTASFAREYERRYHTVLPGYRPMVLNWRLRAYGPEAELPLGPGPGASADGEAPGVTPEARGVRTAYFPETGITEVTVFDRTKLPIGSVVEGPAIVEEAESTTVVNPGDRLTVDALGNLRIRVAT
jgi:5-oxoprolinase (ATP-hydrolysing)/N-methylhydantoinase A